MLSIVRLYLWQQQPIGMLFDNFIPEITSGALSERITNGPNRFNDHSSTASFINFEIFSAVDDSKNGDNFNILLTISFS